MVACRLRLEWAGQQIGEGVSTFICGGGDAPTPTEADALGTAVRTFATGISTFIPANVTMSVNPLVEVFEETTGTLTQEVAMTTTPANVTGTGAETSAAGVGGRVRWRTNGIRNGRRVIGTTFVVPMPSAAYGTDGTLAPGTITALQDAADDLIGLLNVATHPLLVWSRPNPAAAANGQVSLVVSAQVPDQVSWLKTRR